MPDPPQSLAGLSLAEKRQLLAKLLQEKSERRAWCPLSQGQRGLWLLHRMNPLGAAYNLSFPTRFRSRMNVAAFRHALQTLVDRHASLRTTYLERDGELWQRVHEELPVAFEACDVPSASDAWIKSRLEEEMQRPFDLECGPLLRTLLFTRDVDDHLFLAVAHHIVLDFWSLIVMLMEVRETYAAACDGRQASLPPVGSSYFDFVRWQSNLLAGKKGETLAEYWERRLSGVPHVLELPTDRPRPAVFTYRAGDVRCHVARDATSGLLNVAAEERATLYAVLLAAFQVLLSRHSGQTDFAIGTPFAGRSRSEFDNTVGYFVNLLPMRADLKGDPTFRELLRRVSATTLDALEHQDYPFSLIVDRLKVVRDPSRSPLVQASLTLEKSQRHEELGRGRFFFPGTKAHVNVGGLLGEPYYVRQQTCQHDLDLIVEQSGGSIDGVLRYCSDLFDAASMDRMVEHFQTLLAAVAANPDIPLSQVTWFAESERREVIRNGTGTRVEAEETACLHRMFEQQARKTPQAAALRGLGTTYRYAELDAWANRLAHRLREFGVEPGDFVALCVGRTPELMALILATMKAGAAFVPLDPDSPGQRLQLLVADVRAKVVVAPSPLVPLLREGGTPTVVGLDDLADASRTVSDPGPPALEASPEDLAYVIFTSGSTGHPKGVMVAHRAACNMLVSRKSGGPFVDGRDRVLMALPFVFDAAVGETFAPLTQGATVVLADPREELTPMRLAERIVREGITSLAAPPRLLGAILEHLTAEQCRQFRRLHTGGEAMSPELLAHVVDRLRVPFYNCYGPTEAGIETTRWRCCPGQSVTTISIGRPIDNVQVYVLDRNLCPVPVGVPGELHISGDGLARGYLNDTALTAQRFVPNPFSDQPGQRMYRSGDSCRWLSSGILQYLGRLDEQVKVRGYRIELGEIETALKNEPAVADAAVAVLPGRSGEPQLVAYLVQRAGQPLPKTDALRGSLRKRLPVYMVPAVFEWLHHLPRTASGKLDRKSLPAARQPDEVRTPYVAPRTPLEQFLVDSCRKILKVERVGVHDGFYELGGTSIQGALLLSTLQDELNLRVHTAALFDLSTIVDVAHHLASAYPEAVAARFGGESLSSPAAVGQHATDLTTASSPATDSPTLAAPHSNLLIPLQTGGDRLPLFMVHPPGGIVACYQPLARLLGPERPFYGIRSRGLHGECDLPARLEDMAAEYVAGIEAVQPLGPYALGGWSLGGIIAMEVAHQLLAKGRPVELLVFLDTTIPQGSANAAYADDAQKSGLEYGLDFTLEELGQLGPDEQLPYLWDHVRKLGVLDEDAPEAVVQQMLHDLKHLFHWHVKLCGEYRLRPYPGSIVLFRPMDAPVKIATSPDRGWRRLARRVDVHMVPGQHHSMVKEPQVRVLAEKLGQYLL